MSHTQLPENIEAQRILYQHFKRLGCYDPAKEVDELLEDLELGGFFMEKKNAHLTAAAPELLEALETVFERVDHEMSDELYEQVRKAIANAKGFQ